MKEKKSLLIIIASIIMVLLVLVAGVLPLIGGTRALGLNPDRGQGRTGQFNGNLPDGFTPPNGGNFQPGTGGGNFQPGTTGDNGTGNNNFTFDSTMAARMQTNVKLLQLVQYGVGGAVLLFGLLAAIGLWLMKKWGKVLVIITSAIILASTLPNLFRFMGGWSLTEALIKVVLAVIAVILIFLPTKKQATESTPTNQQVNTG